MHNQQLEDSLKFIPNAGIGKIELTFDKEKVINLLGKPILINDDDLDSIYYQYEIDDATLFLFFHYENAKFDYLTVHTNMLYINGVEISKMKKSYLLDFIKLFHDKQNFNYQYELIEDALDYSYDYTNIGLTIWFEDELVSDICIYPCSL